jgi:hypothetical protein
MHSKRTPAIIIGLALVPLLIYACGFQGAPPTASAVLPGSATGVGELDVIIGAAVSGDPVALVPYFEYTRALCTTEQGLGGPPKCLPGEHDGAPVNVLPFLGPGEGSFVREIDAPTWVGPRLTHLYAAYAVTDAAYSEEYYPAGDFALVFARDEASPASVTLQVTAGRIVRIDYGAGWPPQIPPDSVEQYLVPPP